MFGNQIECISMQIKFSLLSNDGDHDVDHDLQISYKLRPIKYLLLWDILHLHQHKILNFYFKLFFAIFWSSKFFFNCFYSKNWRHYFDITQMFAIWSWQGPSKNFTITFKIVLDLTSVVHMDYCQLIIDTGL